jgi:hypothetical protein
MEKERFESSKVVKKTKATNQRRTMTKRKRTR